MPRHSLSLVGDFLPARAGLAGTWEKPERGLSGPRGRAMRRQSRRYWSWQKREEGGEGEWASWANSGRRGSGSEKEVVVVVAVVAVAVANLQQPQRRQGRRQQRQQHPVVRTTLNYDAQYRRMQQHKHTMSKDTVFDRKDRCVDRD